jgi:hypothetical protein
MAILNSAQSPSHRSANRNCRQLAIVVAFASLHLFPTLSKSTLFAQNAPSFKDLDTHLGIDYPSFDLSRNIKTAEDFPQENLSSDQVDSTIAKIITGQNALSLENVITPINSKKLVYLGFTHPARTNLFFVDQEYFAKNDTAIGSYLTNVYKYEHLYVCTRGNTLMDRYLVYYAIRAYLVIKYRYPAIYQQLFERMSTLPVNYLSAGNKPPHINVTQNYMVYFDGVLSTASNNGYFGSKQIIFTGPASGIEVYPNTQLIYLNRRTIRNAGASDTVQIYKSEPDSAKRFHKFMTDGLIHTFVHERLHDWIFQYKNINSLAYLLRNGTMQQKIVTDYYPFEEAVVNNTGNILFEMLPDNGGLSDEVLKFYRNEFDISVGKLKQEGSYSKLKEQMAKLKTDECPAPCIFDLSRSYKSGPDNRLFFINIFSQTPL